MITLSNFIKNADDFTLLLTMGEKDTVDMLPTVGRPFSPDFYAVSVDYGVPAAGSVAINYFTQENFVFVNGEWSKDSVPSILDQLEVDENGVYVPAVGVDGYDKVTVDVPQLDTSDATAAAGDILTGKTAYVKDEKVTGTLGTQMKTAIPSSASQTIAPDTGKLLSAVTVEAAPLDAAKTVTAGTTAQTVSPTTGKLGIKSVTINPTPSSAKTVTPSDEEQTVSPEDGELLSSVTVEAAPLDPPQTAAARTEPLTVFPSSGKIGFPRITINPTPSSAKTVTPTKAVQNITPDDGKLLSGVTVNAIPAQYIIPTGSQTITTNGTVDVTALASVSVNVPSTDIYKHEIYMKLVASDVEDATTSNYADYSTCEIRYDACNKTSRTYSASDLQEIMDYVFPYGNYGIASIKFVNNQSAAASYFSQFKVDDVQTGEFSLSNWEEAGKVMIKDKMTNVTITDTVTKIS